MSVRLQVVISESLDARIHIAAQRARLSKVAWVVRAIRSALTEPCAPSDPLQELTTLGAPTADIDQMLAEIEAGRG